MFLYLVPYACTHTYTHTDYLRLAPSFRVTLEPDTNRSCFSGDIIDDAIALEGDETFDLVLRDPMLDGVTVGERIRTVVVISDDDGMIC